MELVGMQRIANPLKQRGMERIEMQQIANLKQRGMELVEMQPIADYPFLHPPDADKHSFLQFPIMPQLLQPQTIA